MKEALAAVLLATTVGVRHAPYFQRRRWDFFVEHLLGRTPPAYAMKEFN